MFGWFRARCPVDPATRPWIDRRWRWLTDEFGSDLMIDAPTVLPTAEYFPEHYDGSEDSVRSLLDRVCEYMHVSPDLVDLKFYSEANRPQFVNEDGLAIGGTVGLLRMARFMPFTWSATSSTSRCCWLVRLPTNWHTFGPSERTAVRPRISTTNS